MTCVINFFAGPGAGKSTLASHLFAELKWIGINTELAPEVAKEWVWEGHYSPLANQIYIFGNQLQRIRRLQDKVDIVITDSPLLLSCIYDHSCSRHFYELVIEVFHGFNNVNFFVQRQKSYEPSGRIHTAKEALKIDKEIQDLLTMQNITFYSILGSPHAIPFIIEILKQRKVINLP